MRKKFILLKPELILVAGRGRRPPGSSDCTDNRRILGPLRVPDAAGVGG